MYASNKPVFWVPGTCTWPYVLIYYRYSTIRACTCDLWWLMIDDWSVFCKLHIYPTMPFAICNDWWLICVVHYTFTPQRRLPFTGSHQSFSFIKQYISLSNMTLWGCWNCWCGILDSPIHKKKDLPNCITMLERCLSIGSISHPRTSIVSCFQWFLINWSSP